MIALARAGWKVTGVDFASRAVTLAKRKLKNANIVADVQIQDATKLIGINGPFDLAFDLGCFHGIDRNFRPDYLDQLDRILAPGGYWLMYGFLATHSDHAQPGINEAEISDLSSRFDLLSRRDGYDARNRASAWFLFQKGR